MLEISKWGNFALNDNIYELLQNGAKMSRISHALSNFQVGNCVSVTLNA
jgi:hypothetical protein